MSEYDDLIKRLRNIDHTCIEDCFLQSPYFHKAADAIEALVGQRDRFVDRFNEARGAANKAEEEVEGLKGVLAEIMEWIDNWRPPFTQDEEWPATECKARSALEAKP